MSDTLQGTLYNYSNSSVSSKQSGTIPNRTNSAVLLCMNRCTVVQSRCPNLRKLFRSDRNQQCYYPVQFFLLLTD